MASVSKPFPPSIPARKPASLAPHPGLEVVLEPRSPVGTGTARAGVLSLLDRAALWRALFVALCLVTFAGMGAVYLLSLTNYLSVEGDNAIYIILGRALATGHGYMNIQGSVPRIESQYPPLFPLLLAPLVRVWGTDGVAQMQALVAGFALASLALSFFLFRRWLGSAVLAFATVLAAASSDLIWEFSHKVLTEIPYLFFTLLACWWASDYAAQPRWLTRAGTLAVLAAVAAFMTRTIGLSICAMLPLYLLLGSPIRLRGGDWRLRLAKAGWATLLLALLVGAWTLRNRIVYSGQGHTYIGQFFLKQTYVPDAGQISVSADDLLTRASKAVDYYGGVYQRMIVGHLWDRIPERADFSQALLAITVLGFLYALIRRRTLAEFYLLGYVGIVLLWPWTDLRFAVPILPFLIYYIACALLPPMILLARFRQLDPRVATAMLLLPLFIPSGDHTVRTALHDRELGFHYELERLGEWPAYQDWRNFHAAAVWLQANAVPGSTVINRSPNIFYLWTGMHSRNYPYSHDLAYMLSDISHEHNDYVIDDRFSWTYTTGLYLEPVLRAYKDRFFGPFSVPDAHDTKVYQVVGS